MQNSGSEEQNTDKVTPASNLEIYENKITIPVELFRNINFNAKDPHIKLCVFIYLVANSSRLFNECTFTMSDLINFIGCKNDNKSGPAYKDVINALCALAEDGHIALPDKDLFSYTKRDTIKVKLVKLQYEHFVCLNIKEYTTIFEYMDAHKFALEHLQLFAVLLSIKSWLQRRTKRHEIVEKKPESIALSYNQICERTGINFNNIQKVVAKLSQLELIHLAKPSSVKNFTNENGDDKYYNFKTVYVEDSPNWELELHYGVKKYKSSFANKQAGKIAWRNVSDAIALEEVFTVKKQ